MWSQDFLPLLRMPVHSHFRPAIMRSKPWSCWNSVVELLWVLIDDRSDISKLKRSYPEKAATYDRLRNEMNTPMHEVERSSRDETG